ncbi:hypothetical protein GR204_14455 [Rhizobium leguminosarum]|uniref:Uncharacterized protein n=1 Tax=Rhizobium leguminosarum TaxID=384 RepID=A0A6P0B6X9_RHILE|nr:hypothetical protein [Rhizobium leguminosarum]MBY5440808.1 hypothetical protein [Rhizobium leguminosarum]NEI35178.1 hypothetical protein [Rhizobium leguminosarum]NEI41693.1 hypothetical protein [Rhizobium leguminosarum]
MVYISGVNKNRLGKRRFDALFAAGCGQPQQHARDAMPARRRLFDFQRTEPRLR